MPAPRSFRERPQTGVARRLPTAHAERERRKHDDRDVSGDRDECDQERKDADRPEVGRQPEPRRTPPQSALDDRARRDRADEPTGSARDRLGKLGDAETDRGADRGARDRSCCRPNRVDREQPGENYAETKAQTEAEPDRVPGTHAASLETGRIRARERRVGVYDVYRGGMFEWPDALA
jgi:hypothetical protein